MLRVGLTGSIATGKSTVLKAIADLGIPTHSADDAVHRLYSGTAAPLIEAAFPGVVSDGIVDRAKLSAHLAADPDRVPVLEAIVHPLVREEGLDFFRRAAAEGAALAVIEIPLLFETKADYGLDKVIVVATDPAIQRQRALARPGMSVEKLDFIVSRQLDQAEKIKRADIVIDTSATMDDTISRTRAAIATLLAEGEATNR